MKCTFCSYDWESRTESPKSCPRCKRRFDYSEAKELMEMNEDE